MRKTALTAALMLAAMTLNARTVYCELMFEINHGGKDVDVEVIWGEKAKGKDLRKSNGDKVEFDTVTDALDYFGRYGWAPTGANFITDEGKDQHIVLRKEIIDDNQIFEGFIDRKKK